MITRLSGLKRAVSRSPSLARALPLSHSGAEGPIAETPLSDPPADDGLSAWPAGEKMLAGLRVVCRGAIDCAARSLSDRGRSTRRSAQLAAPYCVVGAARHPAVVWLAESRVHMQQTGSARPILVRSSGGPFLVPTGSVCLTVTYCFSCVLVVLEKGSFRTCLPRFPAF